jgi:uncharacterized protein
MRSVILLVWLFFVLTLFITTPAFGVKPTAEGVAIATKVESKLLQSATGGDAKAQFELGLQLFQRMLQSKVPFDGYDEALHWFSLSEEQGYIPAKARLSFLLLWGRPPAAGRDFGRARLLAEEGAAADDPMAVYLLSTIYYLGQGVEKDVEKSYVLETRAADLGWPKAQISLARRFLHGFRVEKNPVESERYLKLAAQGGDVEAQTALGSLYASGSHFDFPSDPKQAVYWLTVAVKSNSVEARFLLGTLQCEGTGTVRSVASGKRLLREAIAQGHKEAIEMLARCHAKKRT